MTERSRGMFARPAAPQNMAASLKKMLGSFSPRRAARFGLAMGSAILLGGAAVMLYSNVRESLGRGRGGGAGGPPVAYNRNSSDCRSCHADIYRDWQESEHAHAHRAVGFEPDRDAFGTPTTIEEGGVNYSIRWHDQRPEFTEKQPGHPDFAYPADFALGHKPLRQYIVPVGGGRYQAAELAFDPAKREWFNVFGDQRRKPGEWGQWRGRGMNWNSMCAHCHLTDYRKNYDPATDTYASTWLEHGVGCVQCHDGLTPDHATPGYKTPEALRQIATDRNRNGQTCAPCHARNELLTGEPRAGMAYHDHFRITLPTDPLVFHPDGQVLDENFNWTSLLTSRMGGKAGVTCLDCHEPHSGRTRLPAANNALCLQCHVPNNPRGAPAIDPMAHSHHAADSTGNQCVTCHMPTTTYMQRAPRHDHGFLIPDPLLTQELGIPNACDRCHADKGIEWQIEWNERWYGAKLDNRQRERTRVVAAAQRGEPGAAARLLKLAGTEEVPAWKASLLLLLRPWAAELDVVSAARAALGEADPLVRSAGVQVLASEPGEHRFLSPLLQDPVRLVRMDAAWALSPELGDESAGRRELDEYLALAADQPAGQLRIGQDLHNRRQSVAAVAALRRAAAWDPHSSPIFETLGLVLDQLGQPAESSAALWRAAELAPGNGGLAFQAALAFAAAGRGPDAQAALREAVRREPNLHRAWYNLALLLAQTGDVPAALETLHRAETIAPDEADYPYARATILWQQGDRDAAQRAARRALAIDPARSDAKLLLEAR